MTTRRFTWLLGLLPAIIIVGLLPAFAANPAVTVNVDAGADRRSISKHAYGVSHASTAMLVDLNLPMNRSGGNSTSSYNWQQNADNKGNDWYFQSIGESSNAPGGRWDTFVSDSRAAGALPMLTIPMVGWVAKLGANRGKLCSYSQAKYGTQTANDWQWFPDAGNGILASNGQKITWNDKNDANVPADSLFQQGWVQHLVGRWGLAQNGGLRYYLLCNEPSIWHNTHRDVHPDGASMDEVRDKILDYATRIKAVDPGALLIGPNEWGWTGYFYSGRDQVHGQATGDWSNGPDRSTHTPRDYMPWLLDQVRQADAVSGRRSLDIFSLHYYPQGGEFSGDVSTAMQLRRNRSTRSLWDPNYTDETWINNRVQLIPRMKSWLAQYYPGLKTMIGEYNWGAEEHISGAIAQADVWGIFGREGLDFGARWVYPPVNSPTYNAMKMYRNYDGSKSTFGDLSVRATVPNPDELAAFASVRSRDGALTVMVLSKFMTDTTPVTLNLANFAPRRTAQVWQMSGANTSIQRLSDLVVAGGSLTTSVPARSITLFVIPSGEAQPTEPPTRDPVLTSSAAARPESVAPGSLTTLTVTVANSGAPLANGIVDLEVYGPNGSRVGQQYWVDQTISSGEPPTCSVRWRAPRLWGTYTLKVGVFGPGWSPLLHWNDRAGTLSVGLAR